ncbi:hypothetical protein KSP40_PGU008170 [Platanthera guangdongensis]|uniref:Ycf15 n=1 Tax=Platanthera guangdongensis TaxID=2320717 RepID=A0ABR2MYB1_9ASPA
MEEEGRKSFGYFRNYTTSQLLYLRLKQRIPSHPASGTTKFKGVMSLYGSLDLVPSDTGMTTGQDWRL